jgi:hypothetical protein
MHGVWQGNLVLHSVKFGSAAMVQSWNNKVLVNKGHCHSPVRLSEAPANPKLDAKAGNISDHLPRAPEATGEILPFAQNDILSYFADEYPCNQPP